MNHNDLTSHFAVPRRTFLGGLMLAAAGPRVFANPGFPDKPVKLVTSSGAGGVVDVVARALSDPLSRLWGQPVIVDNRVGASGMLASEYVARSAPDGYTILLTTQTAHIYNPLLRKTTYQPFTDFATVTEVVQGAIALAAAKNFPANTVAEMIQLARKSGKPLSYGTWGIGSGAHLLGEQLRTQGGIGMTHVPYKNAETGIVQDLGGGVLDVGFLSAAGAKAQAANGRIKILGVTGAERTKQLPTVPTFKEQGLSGMEFGGWVSAFAPAKTPEAVVTKISEDIRKVLAQPEVTARLTALTFDVIGSTSKQQLEANKREYEHWAGVLKDLNIKLD